MTSPGWMRRGAAVAVAIGSAGVLLAGCVAEVAGSAATAAPSTGASITAVSITAVSITAASIASGSFDADASPWASGPASTANAGSLSAPTADAIESPAAWSAQVLEPAGKGMLSPTGDLTAQVIGDQVCFAPDGGIGSCAALAAGVTVTFAVFSQDGQYLLVVAGAAPASGVYVLGTADASARVLGPEGVQGFPAGSVPPAWSLSSAVWDANGNVLLLRTTHEAVGEVLAFDLTTGSVRALIELDADLVNSSPSLWTISAGLAIVPNLGAQRHTLWWAEASTGVVRMLTEFPDPGGSLLLSAADPSGQIVLVCPRRADGQLGPTVGVAVDGSQNARMLKNSGSCAGAAFSADARYLATTALVESDYVLTVVDRTTGDSVLVTSLQLPKEPAVPPYLTWTGDVIVATDLTGDWATPTVLVRLTR